jgi:hypothetical protein
MFNFQVEDVRSYNVCICSIHTYTHTLGLSYCYGILLLLIVCYLRIFWFVLLLPCLLLHSFVFLNY